jgi:hypothetical protein
MTAQDAGRAAPAAEQSQAEQDLHADIERTRAELGATVQQLAAKTHVQARVRQSAKDVLNRARHGAEQARDRVTAAAGGPAGQVSTAARSAATTARTHWPQLAAAVALAGAAVLARNILRNRKRR